MKLTMKFLTLDLQITSLFKMHEQPRKQYH